MARFYSVRTIRKVGDSAYVSIPRIVRHELGINVNDPVEIELDTNRKILIVRPFRGRTFRPLHDMNQNIMLPLADKKTDPPADAPAVQDDATDAKVPA